MSTAADDGMAPGEVDPLDFLASLLRLSPQDAERVRNATPEPEDTGREYSASQDEADD